MTSKIRTERQGPVLTIRLDSPNTRNSLDMGIRDELGAAVLQAERDKSIRAVYLTGEGPTFCSGGNMKLMQDASDPWPTHRRFRALSRWLMPLMCLDKPVVVGVNGAAVGGGMGLALSGDLVVAAESAQFIAGWFRLGAVPDIGVMHNLPRLIGMARTKNFLFGNGTLSACEALELGLVLKVVPDGRLQEEGLGEAMRLAEGPAEVMGLCKALLARSFESTLAESLSLEGFGQALAMANPEFKEGLNAALNKRKPDFVAAASRHFME